MKDKPWERPRLSRAGRVIAFIECLPITSGIFAGQPFLLRPWQKKIIRAIYRTKSRKRMVRTALISMPRKNGKTQLAAGLALAHLLGPEAEQRGQVFSAASDREQAAIIFKELEAFILSIPDFEERCHNGAGKPLGALNDPSLVSVSKEGSQAADTLVIENLSKMYARHYAPQRAVWMANPSIVPQLLTMSIAVGTGGSYIPLMNESNGSFSIFGRPVVFSPSMPALGDANDIAFVDWSQYAVGIRRDLRLEKSNIPGWTTDLMSYRVLVRFDGMGTWDKAITPRNGSTLSWIVGLAERA
jgi:hypothetical protein